MNRRKTAKTIKEFKTNYKGYDLVIPKGSTVTNQTALGPDDNYHFWNVSLEYVEKITGVKNSILLFDLAHYGLNIPAEFCEPY
jgi:hypothetical protein